MNGPGIGQQPSAGDIRTQTAQRKCVPLGDGEVGEQRLDSSLAELLQRARGGGVVGIAAIEQGKDGARIYDDSRHRARSPSAR